VKIAAKKRKLCSESTENLEEVVSNEHNDASEINWLVSAIYPFLMVLG
jgi:hypothetical protein